MMPMKNIEVEVINQVPMEEQRTEIVERKGIGHPDSVADGIAEAMSRALCAEYKKRFGVILHHNTDETQIVAGESKPMFGGGEIISPIYILLVGRATKELDGDIIPTNRVVVKAARDYLHENFPNLLEALFGPGGKIRIFMAAADEHTVVAAYTRRAALRRCLRATKRPRAALVADEGVAATAALLPSGAPVVGYWSPKGTIDFINQAISLFAPDEQSKFALPDFPETPPVGLAATISADEVQTDVVIPGEVLKAIGAYVGEVQTMIAEKNAL